MTSLSTTANAGDTGKTSCVPARQKSGPKFLRQRVSGQPRLIKHRLGLSRVGARKWRPAVLLTVYVIGPELEPVRVTRRHGCLPGRDDAVHDDGRTARSARGRA